MNFFIAFAIVWLNQTNLSPMDESLKDIYYDQAKKQEAEDLARDGYTKFYCGCCRDRAKVMEESHDRTDVKKGPKY
jgi:hypothetical protein